MVVNAVSRSAAVVRRPLGMWSLTVKIPSASTPAAAALENRPAYSISNASTPIRAHLPSVWSSAL